MRGLLTIIAYLFCQTVSGQFGIIVDKDGFVNVRHSAKISNNIIDTLANEEVVFCFDIEGEWFPINYDLRDRQYMRETGKYGYIHKSRVKFIEDFDKISHSNLTDSTITFEKDSLKLIVTKIKFNPENNELQYNGSFVERINGKEVWGWTGDLPRKQYGQITLTLFQKAKIGCTLERSLTSKSIIVSLPQSGSNQK